MGSHATVSFDSHLVSLRRSRSPNPDTHPPPFSLSFPRRPLRLQSIAASASCSSSAGAVEAEPIGLLERCFSSPSAIAAPAMKGKYGAYGAVTLDRGKLDISQRMAKSSPETAIGGGGGDIGKRNFHGSGGGGDDDGDDDDYFGDFDEGHDGEEGGLFRRRLVHQELFDQKFVEAVLQEWCKAITDLPAGFRQACEMGLVSSAQMVRFLAINARPTTARLISRTLQGSMSRAFIGRLLADPSFLYKLLLEQVATISSSVWWEFKNRKERIKQEWDLALINILAASTCNAIIVWSLAPCRSYGTRFHFDLQNTIQKLPNNIFEKSYPLREFNMLKRIQSFGYKAAELSLVGVIAGSVQGALSNLSLKKKEKRLSVTMPSVGANALGYGAFSGLYANLRYQLICGIDRAMLDHFDVLGVATFFSTAFRILNVQVGEAPRLAWLGMEPNPLFQSENLSKDYSSSSESVDTPASKWFISKKTIGLGLGFLSIPQSSRDPSGTSTKSPRKRVVKRKVNTVSA